MKDSMRLFYEMEIKRDDKRVKKYRKRICHSFVKAFADYLFFLFTKYPVTIKATGGNNVSWNRIYNSGGWTEAPRLFWYGPVVGSGYKRNFITPYGPYNYPPMSGASTPSPYVASASSYNSTNFPWRLFDGDGSANSVWECNTNNTGWVKLDTGAGPTKIAKNFWITAYSTSNAPSNFTLQGSNNDSTWDVLYTATGLSWSNYETKYFTLPSLPLTAYRYYKLDITATQGGSRPQFSTLEIEAVTDATVMPVSVTDFAMANTGVSLTYGSNNLLGPTTTSGGSTLTIYRIFDNQSGSDITINEIGLSAQAYPGGNYFLMARDVISPVTVTTGETLTINYIIETNI
jgi:hypothetical protein